MMQTAMEVLISSSVLILALAGLRIVLRGKISARLQYGLWLLVALRLLVPVSMVQSQASVLNFVPERALEAPTATAQLWDAEAILQRQAQAPAAAETVKPDAQEPAAQTAAQSVPARQRLSLQQILLLVWGVGTALTLGWILMQNLRMRRSLMRQRKALDIPDTPVPVYLVQSLTSSCLFGLFRPAIYLTPAALDADGVPNPWILRHELTHFKRRDHIWCAVRLLCLAAYWFDPFVWLAARLSKLDCELACDEAVLKNLDDHARIAYGRTLLAGIAGRGSAKQMLSCATMMGASRRALRARISLIAKKPRMTALTLALVLAISALLAACTFTNRRAEQEASVDLPDLVQIDGTLYQLTQDQVPADDAARVAEIGSIKSYVNYSQTPKKDDQANFPAKGRPYGRVDDQMVLQDSLGQWVFLQMNLPPDAVSAAVIRALAPDTAEICQTVRCRTGTLVATRRTNADGSLDALLLLVQKTDGEIKLTQMEEGSIDDTLGYGVFQTQLAGQAVVFGIADRRLRESESGNDVSLNFNTVTAHFAGGSVSSSMQAAPGEAFLIAAYDMGEVTSVHLSLGDQGDAAVFTDIPAPGNGSQAAMTLGENWADAEANASDKPALTDAEVQAIRQTVFEKFSTAQWDWDNLTEDEARTFEGADARKNGMVGNYPNYYGAFADYFAAAGKAPGNAQNWYLSLPADNLLELRIEDGGETLQKLYYSLGTGALCGRRQEPLLLDDTPVGIGVVTDYADENILVFHGYFGLFVYDLAQSQMRLALDLSAATGSTNIQGGYGNAVSVWNDAGNVKVMLTFYDDEQGGLAPVSYSYDTANGELRFTTTDFPADSISSEGAPAHKVTMAGDGVKDLTYSDGTKTWKLFEAWNFGHQTDAAIVPLTIPEKAPSEIGSDDFFQMFWEIDQDSMQAYLDAHPEALTGGWAGININESGLDQDGTSIRTTMGEQVLAINYREKTLLVRVEGEKYRGVLAVAKDASRLSVEMSQGLGSYGQVVGEIAEANGGILAMNCNGFIDPGGQGNGGEMAGFAMSNGVAYGEHFPYSDAWPYVRFEILTDNTVCIRRSSDAVRADCRDATEFNPALIVDGEVLRSDYWTDENPRACIGQSGRGEMLLLVIEGRMPDEDILGTSVNECAAILLRHGAQQAMNVDGGASAILWYDGQYVTRCSNHTRTGRALPNAFVYHKS